MLKALKSVAFLFAITMAVGISSAGATTVVYLLVRADTAENAQSVAEKIHNSNFLQDCKTQAAVPLRFNEIVAVMECENSDKNISAAVATVGQLEHVDSVMLFASSRAQ